MELKAKIAKGFGLIFLLILIGLIIPAYFVKQASNIDPKWKYCVPSAIEALDKPLERILYRKTIITDVKNNDVEVGVYTFFGIRYYTVLLKDIYWGNDMGCNPTSIIIS